MINKTIGAIENEFLSNIERYSIEYDNQLNIEVDFEKVSDMCMYIHEVLNLSLISMFANDGREISDKSFVLYYIFSDRKNNYFIIIKSKMPRGQIEFKSIANKVYSASWYEREIQDLFGLKAVGHPYPKRLVFHSNWPDNHFPLRKDYQREKKPEFVKRPQSFSTIKGEGVFEIPVGPVHAGIIEPGHFRFSVAGEPIINLETQLYYTHKGIEKLSESMDVNRCFYLSERISGDESFSNSFAYCQAIEKIAGIEVTDRAQFTRIVFAELERITAHMGDLAGLCGDMAYNFGNYQFKLIRGWSYALADELCGMRFLRSVNKLGGIRKDFLYGKEKLILNYIKNVKKELEDTVSIIKSKNVLIDRVEETGVLEKKIAFDLNTTGPAGRASGIDYDVRRDHPYGGYRKIQFEVPQHNNGDVNCRMNVKIEETFQSLYILEQVIDLLEEGSIIESIGDLTAYRSAIGYTESPRGENIHWLMVGKNNMIYRYKIRTPSFSNWTAFIHAVKGNIVPDFPLINKSFNLSYAGNDL